MACVYNVPVYGRPDDLVQLTPDVERARYNDGLSCMRQTEQGLVPYYTRSQIEAGALEGRGLELVYLDDPVELFFMQVQGSGLVLLNEGGAVRLGYAGKNGHPYGSIGARLVERGALRGGGASMQAVKAWLRADPARGRALMAENKSYVFFRPLDAEEERNGPLGPHGVALTPGRSLAVDAAIHALGTPIFVAAPGLRASDGRPFRRLMIAQDVARPFAGPSGATSSSVRASGRGPSPAPPRKRRGSSCCCRSVKPGALECVMGKRDKDSELWARVAETARPLKGRKRAAVSPPPVSPARVKPPPASEQKPGGTGADVQARAQAPPGRRRGSSRPPRPPDNWRSGASPSRRGSTCTGLRQRDAHAAAAADLSRPRRRGGSATCW